MTFAGISEVGLTSLRRAIDFVCYIAKIKKSDKLAEIWLSKRVDQEKLKEFKGKFNIPKAFFNDKYGHLKSLLVFHEFASEFGVHGNYESLVMKMREDPTQFSMSFHDKKEDAIRSAGTVAVLGCEMIDALVFDLKEMIKNNSDFLDKISFLKQTAKNARIEIYKKETGKLPDNILAAINKDDKSIINQAFEELKSKYSV